MKINHYHIKLLNRDRGPWVTTIMNYDHSVYNNLRVTYNKRFYAQFSGSDKI